MPTARPIRTTTGAVVLPSAAMCETIPSAPIAAATDVSPSSSGTTAAASAPKANTRIRA